MTSPETHSDLSKRKLRRQAPHAILAAALVLLLACLACGNSQGGGQMSSSDIARTSTLESILQRGTLRVGLEAGYMPFEMRDIDGNFLGFDVELARVMADRLGVELQIINTNWDGIIPSLNTGKFDIIMSGMTRTLERARAVNFTDPYFVTGQTLLVSSERAPGVESPRDLDSKDRTIVVKLGTTGDFAAEKVFEEAQIRKFETEAEAVLEVAGGRADALVYDAPFVRIWAAQNPESVYPLLEPFTHESLAFAVRKGDHDFLVWLNLFIHDIKHDDPVDSTYDRLRRKYFEDMDWLDKVEK